MNVYDVANELKRALIECPELKNYKVALEKVKVNTTNKKMLDDLRKKQMELEAIHFSGKEPEKDKIEELEKLYSIASINSDINNFLQCEYRLGVLMNDISKIISEAVDVEGQA